MYMVLAASTAQSVSELGAQYFAKDTLGLEPADMDFYLGFYAIGWILKPVWGYLTDSCPIHGQRRKPHIIIVLVCSSIGFLCYSQVHTLSQFVCVLVLTNMCLAYLSVISQALLVQTNGQSSSRITSYFIANTCFKAALMMLAGWVITFAPPRFVLTTTAWLFLGVLLLVPMMNEGKDPNAGVVTNRDQVRSITLLLGSKDFWCVATYVMAFMVKPRTHYLSAMFFFYTDVLGFGPQFITTIPILGSVASIIAYLIFHYFLAHVPFRWLSGVGIVALSAVFTAQLLLVFRLNVEWGFDDRIFVLTFNFVYAVICEILWLPMIIMVSKLCPTSIEGTSFAFWLSLNNAGIWISGIITWAYTTTLGITRENLANLWLLVIMCALTTLLPLLVLPVLGTRAAVAAGAQPRMSPRLATRN